MPYKVMWECTVTQTDNNFNPIGDVNEVNGVSIIPDGYQPTLADLTATGSTIGTSITTFLGGLFPVIQSEILGQ